MAPIILSIPRTDFTNTGEEHQHCTACVRGESLFVHVIVLCVRRIRLYTCLFPRTIQINQVPAQMCESAVAMPTNADSAVSVALAHITAHGYLQLQPLVAAKDTVSDVKDSPPSAVEVQQVLNKHFVYCIFLPKGRSGSVQAEDDYSGRREML